MFRSSLQRRGRASREIGDAILVVGPRAASVQVKSRLAPTSDAQRERAWLDKEIAAGIRQASGTIRQIKRAGSVTLTNERGRRVTIAASSKRWLTVVVVDHPGVDGYVPPAGATVLLRGDWEFLFEQLRSTYAVLEYIERIGRSDPEPLGRESVRYYELAAADVVTAPEPLDPRLAALEFDGASTPLLPQQPAGHGTDAPQILIRILLEDIATVQGEMEESHRLELLAGIDSIPLGYRTELASDALAWLNQVSEVEGEQVMWWLRRLHWTDRPVVLLGAASRHNSSVEAGFYGWVKHVPARLARARA